mmetsp:Transcript_54525/g.125663  ORF Transcript_54525/g.125663 Transcript_54525/m.125663 type:complete len:225 (+) Transcript_54525:559-1233(+)
MDVRVACSHSRHCASSCSAKAIGCILSADPMLAAAIVDMATVLWLATSDGAQPLSSAAGSSSCMLRQPRVSATVAELRQDMAVAVELCTPSAVALSACTDGALPSNVVAVSLPPTAPVANVSSSARTRIGWTVATSSCMPHPRALEAQTMRGNCVGCCVCFSVLSRSRESVWCESLCHSPTPTSSNCCLAMDGVRQARARGAALSEPLTTLDELCCDLYTYDQP